MTSTGLAPTSYPRFRRHLRVEVGSEEVFLFDERGVLSLSGGGVTAIAPMMDGTRDVLSLVAARPAGMSSGEVGSLIEQLVGAALVVTSDTPDAGSGPAQAWWEGCGDVQPPPGLTGATGPQAVVELSALGGSDAEPVAAALAAAGVASRTGLRSEASTLALSVVLCADYLDPGLAEIDAEHRRSGRPWLLASTSGARLWVGPLFRPGRTACWHCLSHRLSLHRRPEELARASLGLAGPVRRTPCSVPPSAAANAQLVALEAVKWLGGFHYAGQDSVWVWDSYAMRGHHHEVRRRPQCAHCGDPGLVAEHMAAPVVLRPAMKVGGSGGGHRTASPSDVLARHRHLVGPVTGVVKRVAPDPAAPPFVHAWQSGVNVSRGVKDMAALRRSLRGQNGGKGLSALDAEVGALCEAVERHSGTWQGDEPRVRGTMRGLGEAALDPRSCLLFDPRQFAARADWNAEHSLFNHVPEPFSPDAEHDWSPVWSLTGQRRRLLPTAMLFFGAPGDASLFSDSNGCAAGASREDAVLQALLELVERDAVGLWWYNRTRAAAVDLAAFGDGRFVEQVREQLGIGRDLWVLDVTSDLGVPVMAAVSRLRAPAPDGGERIVFGFGAHLDPAVAVARALAEVNQIVSAAGMDVAATGDPDWIRWAGATVSGREYLLPDPDLASTGPVDHPVVIRPDVRDDVRDLVHRLAGLGLETLVIDQTRPDLAIPVVRVIVPGLRSFWARFAPGRLFDVPVRLRRQHVATRYGQLNPEPLFL